MNDISAIVGLIGILGFLFAVINLIYPIRKLGIATRKSAMVVLIASFGLVVTGIVIHPGKQSEQDNRDIATTQDNLESAQSEQQTDDEPNKISTEVEVSDQTDSIETGVVSDRFVLLWDLDGTDLSLAIDTDLPDATEVIVSVIRVYYEVGKAEAYSESYFSERARISDWRTARRVPINDEIWKANLKAKQEKMARISSDVAFEIDRIEDQIVVRAVVHSNQPDPIFGGRGNPNLSGEAVSKNIVEAEKKIKMPLSGTPPAKKANSVLYNALKEGETYRLLKKTPLMAVGPKSIGNFSLEETLKILEKTLHLPAGQVIRVVSIDRNNGPNPWYQVELTGDEKTTGWINSTALRPAVVAIE